MEAQFLRMYNGSETVLHAGSRPGSQYGIVSEASLEWIMT